MTSTNNYTLQREHTQYYYARQRTSAAAHQHKCCGNRHQAIIVRSSSLTAAAAAAAAARALLRACMCALKLFPSTALCRILRQAAGQLVWKKKTASCGCGSFQHARALRRKCDELISATSPQSRKETEGGKYNFYVAENSAVSFF